MSNKGRLLYPDIVKFIAIFIVTWSHCAQLVSGQVWTGLWGGTEIDIAFNMPLFMIISGWFINPQRIRNTGAVEFIISKFKRLMIPSIVWYLIHIALLFALPGLGILTYYWYLNALFICHCIIFLFCKLCKKDVCVIVFSTLFVLLCPFSDFCHVNFMLPFLWSGFLVRHLLEKGVINKLVWVFALIGLALCLWWEPKYTVYVSPFNIMSVDMRMIAIYLYRFLIGLSLSVVIVYVIAKYENTLKFIAKYGQYSLIIYTFSLAILSALKPVLNNYNLHTNQYGVIDILSLLFAIIIVVVAIFIRDVSKKSKYSRLLLLGE